MKTTQKPTIAELEAILNDPEAPAVELMADGSIRTVDVEPHHAAPEIVLPWKHKALAEWAIVGMNHYRIDGKKRLFVAMVKDGDCIKAEGGDNTLLWDELVFKARSRS